MQSILLDVIRNILSEYEKGSSVSVEGLLTSKLGDKTENALGQSYMNIAEKLRMHKWIVNDPMNPNACILGEEGKRGLGILRNGTDEERQEVAELFEVKRCMWEMDIPVSEKRTVLSGKHTKQMFTKGICGKPARHVVRDGDRDIYACDDCVEAVRKTISEK